MTTILGAMLVLSLAGASEGYENFESCGGEWGCRATQECYRDGRMTTRKYVAGVGKSRGSAWANMLTHTGCGPNEIMVLLNPSGLEAHPNTSCSN